MCVGVCVGVRAGGRACVWVCEREKESTVEGVCYQLLLHICSMILIKRIKQQHFILLRRRCILKCN